jgi:hypothetical protein
VVAAALHALNACLERPDEEHKPIRSDLLTLVILFFILLYRRPYRAIVDETGSLKRLMDPELILNLTAPVDGVRYDVSGGKPLRFVPKYDELIFVRIHFWMRSERFSLDLAKRIIAPGF